MMDKRAFILGMITAFCECVAGRCKRLALSPPLTHDDYEWVHTDAESIIEKHGLIHYHEENQDHPGFEWIVIAGKPDTLNTYLALRNFCSPVEGLAPFADLLSYNPAESIHSGYDAYREFFPLERN